MNEPQVWVLIGVFATAVIGMMSWQTVSFNRNLRVSIDALGTRIDALRETTDVRFSAVEARLTTVETKIDGLDRDVQALTRHVFGSGAP